MKKPIVLLLGLFILLFSGCEPVLDYQEYNTSLGYPTKVTINPTSRSITMNDTLQLTATVVGGTAEHQAVTWSSENPTVATVDQNGLVQPISLGSAKIKVQTVYGGHTAYSTITVSIPTVTSITFDGEIVLDLNPATGIPTISLNPVIASEYAPDKTLTWSTDNPWVADISEEGLVTAIGVGTTTIRATSVANPYITAGCTVTVVSTPSDYKRLFALNLYNPRSFTYSRQIDKIAFMDSDWDNGTYTNWIVLIDPTTGTITKTEIPEYTENMTIAPDGLTAVIGSESSIITIDISGEIPEIIHTWPITTSSSQSSNNAIDSLGNVYTVIYSYTDSLRYLHQINYTTGEERLINIPQSILMSTTFLRSTNSVLYFIQSSAIGKIDISNPALDIYPVYFKDTGYGNLFWYYDTGAALISSTGSTHAITQNQATDLINTGNANSTFNSSGLIWADHHSLSGASGSTGLIAIISKDANFSRNRTTVALINDSSFALENKYFFPTFLDYNQNEVPGNGYFCFWNSDGTELYALINMGSAETWHLVAY